MNNVAIIGYGRFGKTLHRILKGHFEIDVFDKGSDYRKLSNSHTIFLTVPISETEKVIKKISKYLTLYHTVIDTCSVKTYPESLFKKYNLPCEVILTHPMFGPDSAKNSTSGLPIVMWSHQNKNRYDFWKNHFQDIGLKIVEMSPDEHDRLAAYSQGVTHYIGRVLGNLKLTSTPINTKGFEKILEIIEQTTNDTWQLFNDLQNYNPYTSQMRKSLEKSIFKTYNRLLPKRADKNYLIIGVQGGKGSFNEEACRHYCEENNITDYKIKYLYTSERVLKALHDGKIDRGQFAIQNSIGGVVKETIHALSKYRCNIIEEFHFPVHHYLLKKPGSKFNKIMSHPQALAQCKSTLSKKYPDIRLVSGTGDLIDQSKVASYISRGKIRNTAVLVPRICSELYNLEIVDEKLEDDKNNITSFLFVKRI